MIWYVGTGLTLLGILFAMYSLRLTILLIDWVDERFFS